MRTLTILIMALLASVARPASAQQPSSSRTGPGQAFTELSGGYAFLHEQPPAGADAHTYSKGWVASGAGRLFGRLMVVGEVGGSYRRNDVDETERLHAFLGGVRYRLGGGARAGAFIQGLAGIERFTEPGLTQSGFAIQPGGGFDLRVTRSLGVRAQADYRIAKEEGFTFKETRLSVGAVWWVGR